ncbi:MAG: hypothetical protein V3R77_07165 [Candidatus Binatia bacterium]
MEFGAFPDLDSLVAALAEDLCGGADHAVAGNSSIVAEVVGGAIRENFRIEEEINRAADSALRQLGSEVFGMDKGKLLAGIRDRLAKQRGFVL